MTQLQNLILLADSPDSLRDLLAPIMAELYAANKTDSMATLSTATPSTVVPKGLMSKEELCREFGISSTTLTEWMKKGFIPFLRYDRRVYFERSAVLEAGRRHTKYQRD